MMIRRLLMTIATALAAVTAAVAAGAAGAQMPPDVAGARDHPALSRYAGSWLVGRSPAVFDELVLPAGPTATARVEGQVHRFYYLGPAGRSVLEVQRNYEDALQRAGARRIDGCAPEACGGRALRALLRPPSERATGDLGGWDSKTLTDEFLDPAQARYWYGTLDSGGRTLHVAVLSAPSYIVALRDRHVATAVLIVEPRPMDSGQVTVNAAALAQGLQAQGRIALYGVFFDTGKAEIKPESKPQLDEMGRLLQAQPALKVHVVGHTDNQGTLEGNLALSRQRAQAVVDALVKSYKVDPKRLSAAGVASYAPLASNVDDAGRARNRRVELVVQ
jgi:outer membrane protein OmpA-like peptidoglycan-associated protein